MGYLPWPETGLGIVYLKNCKTVFIFVILFKFISHLCSEKSLCLKCHIQKTEIVGSRTQMSRMSWEPVGALAYLHTPAAAFPFMGQYQWRPGRSGPGSPRAGAVLGSAFGLCGLWAEPALSRLKTSPAASKGRFASTLAGCSRKPRTLLLSPGEKRFGVVPSQCYGAAWMGGKLGGEWIHVYEWLSSFTVPLKLSQHCYTPTKN